MSRPEDPAEYVAAEVFARFPQEAQQDGAFQVLFDDLMTPGVSWSEAHDIYNNIHALLDYEYGIDFDDYFDWEDWRDNYDASAA
jgi:hypothetical protein